MNWRSASQEPHDHDAMSAEFTRAGAAARDVQPAFSVDLHDRIMARIAGEPAPTRVACVAGPQDNRTLATRVLAAAMSLAACVAFVTAAMLAGQDHSAGTGSRPAFAQADRATRGGNSDRSSAATQLAANAPETLPVASLAAPRDHEVLTSALSYMLSLGMSGTRDTAKPAPRKVVLVTDDIPWVRPTVTTDAVAFELDSRRLEQLADALFAAN